MGNEPTKELHSQEDEDKNTSKAIRRMDKLVRTRVRKGVTYNMKILLRGERGVGKTSLMKRL